MATAIALPETSFAYLHEPAPGTATEADLERAGKPVCELIDGVLVEKPTGA